MAWAFCCAQLVRGVAVHLRRGSVGLPVGASLMDRLAARIALGILALSSVGAPLVLTSPAGADPTSSTHAAAAAHPVDTATVGMLATPARHPPIHFVHFVQPDETLWSIADAHSGDGADWTSIAALNLGVDMADGARFVDPDHIRAGWQLRLAPGSSRVGLAAEASATDTITCPSW